MNSPSPIIIGSIVGVHGLAGWLKVKSYASPPEQLTQYSPIQVGGHEYRQYQSKTHQKGLMIRLPGLDDRTSAEPLVGSDIEILSSQLPETAEGEYYWHQLIGLDVYDQRQKLIGSMVRMLETGANDVMAVQLADTGSEELIPWVPGRYVIEVDLDQGRITVDWDSE